MPTAYRQHEARCKYAKKKYPEPRKHKDRTCAVHMAGEWRGTAEDGRRWWHIAIPLSGYVAYEGVPARAADYFDKIPDTMYRGRCPYCQK